MSTFELEVLAAEKTLYKGKCISLVVPTSDGQYGIQAMHRNMIAAVIPGMLKFTVPDGTETIAAVSEGLVKVEDNQVLLLVDTAELPEEIDINQAKLSAEQAKEALLQKKSMEEYRAAQAKMARALSRMKVKKNRNAE